MQELLREMNETDNPALINKNASQLINEIQSRKARRRNLTTEEMRAILEERDNAVIKVLYNSFINMSHLLFLRHSCRIVYF